MRRSLRHSRAGAGFTLLPVVLAMSLIGAIAFMLNRDNGLSANLIGGLSDRARARYAAEAGLQAVNYTIQDLGCGGPYPISSSPVTDGNFGAAAYSAHANSTTGSPLTLTSTGTYNGASVTLTKTNAYVYQSGVRTWVTQPGVTGKDATVDRTAPIENYGGETRLEIDRDEKQILIQFDLSPLPAGSRIVHLFQAGVLQPGAKISLYQYDNNPQQSFSVKLITHDWVAGTSTGSAPNALNPGVTWNQWNSLGPSSNIWPQGPGNGYHPGTLVVVAEPSPKIGWLDIPLTAAAAGWTSGVYPNYGVWLVGTNPTRDYKFYSSNAVVNAARRPRFTANYLLPCGAVAPT